MKKMVQETLSKEERSEIKIESKFQFDNFVQNLNSSADDVKVRDWDEDSVAGDDDCEDVCVLSQKSKCELVCSEIREMEEFDCYQFHKRSSSSVSDNSKFL